MLTEDEINSNLMPEWAQARARTMRWGEEVELLEEEMRRVVVYLRWHLEWWKSQAARRIGCEEGLQLGLCCYAFKQAANLASLANSSLVIWKACYNKLGRPMKWVYDLVISDTTSLDLAALPQHPISHGAHSTACGEDSELSNETLTVVTQIQRWALT